MSTTAIEIAALPSFGVVQRSTLGLTKRWDAQFAMAFEKHKDAVAILLKSNDTAWRQAGAQFWATRKSIPAIKAAAEIIEHASWFRRGSSDVLPAGITDQELALFVVMVLSREHEVLEHYADREREAARIKQDGTAAFAACSALLNRTIGS